MIKKRLREFGHFLSILFLLEIVAAVIGLLNIFRFASLALSSPQASSILTFFLGVLVPLLVFVPIYGIWMKEKWGVYLLFLIGIARIIYGFIFSVPLFSSSFHSDPFGLAPTILFAALIGSIMNILYLILWAVALHRKWKLFS